MKVYFDSSSLVKLYVDEPGSKEVTELAAQASTLVVSVVAYAEARAAFARLRRIRDITPAAAAEMVVRLDADWHRFVTIDVTGDLTRRAGLLADRFNLRGSDAIHLASFELVLERAGDDAVYFSSADDALAKAAKKLG